MSFTAILWVTLYCASIVFALQNPLFAALGYLLEYYMRPELKWWGDELPVLRYNLIMSLALGGSFLLRRGSLRELVPTHNPTLKWLLGMAAVMLFVSATMAVNPTLSWHWMTQWIKMAVIFPLLVIGVVRTRGAFNWFIIANILGAFWWGWDAWMDPSREDGRLKSIGSGDSFDDNGAALHLMTILPFSVLYLLTEKDIRLRVVSLMATPFIVNTLILCNSRGASVGIGVAILVAILTIRKGYRVRLVATSVAMIGVLLLFADEQFLTRQQSTANYEEDGSAMQRLATWEGGFELIKDWPLGAGGRGFHALSPRYIPEIVAAYGGEGRAPHNTWVMVPSEWGIPGLVCFLGIFAAAFGMLRRIEKRSRGPEYDFFYWRALTIKLSLVGYLVGATFTDRLYAEAGYWLVALSYALYRIQATELAEAGEELAPIAQPAEAIPLRTPA